MAQITDDIHHLQGQVLGLRALVLALGNLLLTREDLREEGLTRLEAQRDALLAMAVSDRQFEGLASVEQWLLKVTESDSSPR